MVFFIGLLGGRLCWIIVRSCKLDRKYRFFRFSNKWHYIFSGECLDFPDTPDDYEEITDKIINVLCRVNNKTILYTGEYFNYYIDNNGNLEAVHLKYPIRRMLEDDKKDIVSINDYNTKYYEIESRYLVIPNSDIININFRYLNFIIVTEEELESISANEKKEAINIVINNQRQDL